MPELKLDMKLKLKKVTGTSEKGKRYQWEIIKNQSNSNVKENSNQLMHDLQKEDRTINYKTRKINKCNFENWQKLPNFNVGKKHLKLTNADKLKRTLIAQVDKPDNYLELDEFIDNLEEFRNGTINIEKEFCNRKGIVSLVCENGAQKDNLQKILKDKNYDTRNVKIKNFVFIIYRIPKSKSSAQILEEIKRRDKRFDNNSTIIKDRFPITKRLDAITVSVNYETMEQIKTRPFTYIGKNKHSVEHFVELIQCYKCSKFGHKTEECRSTKLFCPNCGLGHELKECKTDFIPKCNNCFSLKIKSITHSSWDVRCPYRIMWIKKQKEYG
jgi:hypothetical protein